MSTTTKQDNKVPKLRFPGFEPGWEECLLGEICTIKTGKKDVNQGNPNGKYPFFTCAKNHTYSDEYSFDCDAVLIAGNGEVGHSQRYSGKFEAYQRTYVLSDFTVNYNYVWTVINTLFQDYVASQTQMGAMPYIKLGMLKGFSVPLPTEDEQQKIADFLGSVDAWLDNLRQQKTALETYKRGVMQKLFTQQIRFKDDSGNDFPEWTTVQISDVGDTFNGLSGKSANDFGEGEPYITYKQIFDNSSIDPTKFALVKVASSERQSRAQRGDILFTTSSETPEEVGYASVLTEDLNPYLNSFSFGYRPKSLTTIMPEYARYHFRSAPFRREVVKLAQGSTRYNISKVQFMKLATRLPSPAEQQKIADFLTAIDQTITAKAEEITKVEQWKKGLMQKMFV